ncbi:adenosine deaminase [Clostridium saccharobutylicum]|uniref:Adenosine deaminase n=1 Tax=Clostridium saccharobutylicum DSM 13864 TaxID=1345695 RepID=U5MU98_CLOSA|nr:adenosine deaminase [Clostridium saccharobutylicum]AGX43236.1 adenosine deaminase Add [Clostridium saccharobutylicum DSM 13864]AQR90537.1 adenine deaminase [Clostridium saccharobutylicum]AQS00441.1 adenine deaminase [Clostridium saccharobutylicum]AQS10090.1 adenine deaminase [Clostridium saccharobutylicum]AQS14424.1 adenine deaminase [Clostridium saccharobutylicum]
MNLKTLPKIELHCHLDGSLRPETIIDIANKECIDIPSTDVNYIQKEITAPLECRSLDEYLKAFAIPNLVMQSKESLRRITFELFEDAAKENVKYMEVRFAPLLHTIKGLTVEEIIQSVIDGITDAEEKYDIKGNVILSCMRTMSADKAFEVVEKGKTFLGKGVVAVDLCASEEEGFCKKFVEPIKLAKQYGYRVTIHAGETGIGKNVLDAVQLLDAERIGHGVFIKDCDEAYKIVKERNVTLEMCPTSNVQTKAVNSFSEHPIYNFHKDEVKITLNTDNRTVSNTNMTNEIHIIADTFHIDFEDYKQIYYNSVEASFADSNTKEKLKKYI